MNDFYGQENYTADQQKTIRTDVASGLTLQEAKKNVPGDTAYKAKLSAVPTTINSGNLAGGSSPVILPNPTINTTADGVIASSQNTVVDAEKQAAANLKLEEAAAGVGTAQKEKTGVLDYIKGLYGKESQAYTDITSSPEKQQLLTEQQSLTDINKEIADQNVKYRGEADAITGNGSITKEGQNSNLQNLKDNYGRRLADLAIRQSAASGNVTRLQTSVKDALDLRLAPIEREIAYYKDFAIHNLDNLDAKEQKTLDRIIAEKKTQADKITADHKVLNDYLTEAAKNGVKVPDAAVAEAQKDPVNTPQIFAKYRVSLENLTDKAYKQAQIASLNADAAKKMAEVNGNLQTITTTNPDGTTSIKVVATNGKETQTLSLINDINNALSSGVFDSTFGIKGLLTRGIPSTPQYALTSNVNNILDQLALAARGQLKGQGAVSDFEGKMLRSAQTALKLNLSPNDARREFAKVKGAIATSSGLKAQVKITNPKTGESQLVDADSAGVSQAIKDGLNVEYQ